MPSPVGHALGGIAAAWAAAPGRTWRAALALSFVAAAPDLDLLAGVHRGASHSLGAACLAGVAAGLVWRQPRWGVAVALAWASHVLLDAMSNDTRTPIGVMALWPFTHDYYKAGIELFPAVSRRYWLAEFWAYNLRAVALEVVILGPIAGIAIWLVRRNTRVGQ